jgi:ubiquinone/menaquinone biosynthesis C-methylase UbiE
MKIAAKVKGLSRALTRGFRRNDGSRQAIEIYFDPQFAAVLETWAIDSAWREIALLLGGREGKVLDLACGTGRAQDFLKSFSKLEYHGCDISAPLIERAKARGIPRDRLRVADATSLDYKNGEFDYLFSIGSLEHFTEDGLDKAIAECRRVCRGVCFHQVPVSISAFDEGWITPYQSYWNNSESWWRDRFARLFGQNVWVMSSRWSDAQSRGVWFICTSD